jgi:hypothetical protein
MMDLLRAHLEKVLSRTLTLYLVFKSDTHGTIRKRNENIFTLGLRSAVKIEPNCFGWDGIPCPITKALLSKTHFIERIL